VLGVPPPPRQPLAIVLSQHGDTVTGQLNLSGWLPLVADVTGILAPDGALTLQGGQSWPGGPLCRPPGGWRIASWNGRYDRATDALAGAFSFVTQKHLSSCYYTTLDVTGNNLSLARRQIQPARFEGHWQGTVITRTCTAVGWTDCFASDTGEAFDLVLTQQGNSVSGRLGSFGNPNTGQAVSGTVSADGGSLALQASNTNPQSGGITIWRMTSWATTADVIGRMQGGYSWIHETHWTLGPNAGTVWSKSYTAELRNVVRMPW
jgi:hypothetical protein